MDFKDRMKHTHLFVGRVRRDTLPGTDEEIISLELGRDHDVFEIRDGDEFVTVLLAVDPFK